MNTLNYFQKREKDDIVRADIHEGAEHCLQADGAKLCRQRGNEWVDIGIIGQIVSSAASKDTTNVFCMYALRESAANSLVDQRNFKFGDTYAVLIDADEFLRRVSVTAAKKNLKLKQGLVEYVDKHTYNGTMGAFRKFNDFLFQSEFRIVVESGVKTPISLRVGDLTDIAMTGPLEKINEQIRISNDDGKTRLRMRRCD